jgi:hypothetical protein
VRIVVNRQFQFGTDSVIGRDQERIGKPRRLEIEKAPKSAEIGVCPRASGGLRKWRNQAHEGIARIDGNARLGIGIGRAIGHETSA